MAKTFKKFLALALVLSLVMGMTGMAYAADEPTEGAVAENVEIINDAPVAEDENIEEEPAPVEDSTTVGTIPTENGEPVTSVVEEVVAAEEVATTAEVDTAEALAEALANNSVKLIQLTANINITSQIDIKRDLTLNGNGHTLTYTNSDSETSHISAIQIWGARVLIRDLSIEHNTGAALIVNGGADVTADKLTTSSFDSDSRLWGGVNVDGRSRFTAYSLTCNEAVKVWSEDAGKGSTVSIDGYVTVYGVDGAKVHFTTEEVAKSNPAVKAEVGGNYYGSLQAAIDAAGTAGDVVTLVNDTAENVVIGSDKNITLDLNGCTLKGSTVNADYNGTWKYKDVTVGKGTVTNFGTLAIKDSSGATDENSMGKIVGMNAVTDTSTGATSGKIALVNMNGATCTIESGMITRETYLDEKDYGQMDWHTSNYTVQNMGRMYIRGGRIVNDSNYSSLVVNFNNLGSIAKTLFISANFRTYIWRSPAVCWSRIPTAR